MNRREAITALAALGTAIAPHNSIAQPPKIRRVGALAFRSRSTPANPEVFYDSFTRGMRALGYVEGKNLAIEWRFADGKSDRLPALAAELVRMNVEVWASPDIPDTFDRWDDDIGGVQWNAGDLQRSSSVRQ